MLFNRFADWEIDQRNPRTRSRHLLANKKMTLACSFFLNGLFVFFAANINWLTFALSPLALAFIFFYSLTKHFTDATHFFLGLRTWYRADRGLDRANRSSGITAACSCLWGRLLGSWV